MLIKVLQHRRGAVPLDDPENPAVLHSWLVLSRTIKYASWNNGFKETAALIGEGIPFTFLT